MIGKRAVKNRFIDSDIDFSIMAKAICKELTIESEKENNRGNADNSSDDTSSRDSA